MFRYSLTSHQRQEYRTQYDNPLLFWHLHCLSLLKSKPKFSLQGKDFSKSHFFVEKKNENSLVCVTKAIKFESVLVVVPENEDRRTCIRACARAIVTVDTTIHYM